MARLLFIFILISSLLSCQDNLQDKKVSSEKLLSWEDVDYTTNSDKNSFISKQEEEKNMEMFPKEFNAKYLGRTYLYNEELVMNFSQAGIEFYFCGKTLQMEFKTDKWAASDPTTCAYLGIVIDDEFIKKIPLDSEIKRYDIYSSDEEKKVKIAIVKLTEASHAKCSITKIIADKNATPTEKKDFNIEFIGDSITCGYGNEVTDPTLPFSTGIENAYISYAAITARNLNAQLSTICVSGIGVYSSYTGENKRNDAQLMPTLYEYSDALFERSRGEKSPSKWDFSANKSDLIVINIGTNDDSYLHLAPEKTEEFKKAYKDFLVMIRKNNPDSVLLSTLGSISVSLFDVIKTAVGEYTEETGDNNIDTFVFSQQQQKNGIGANWHPSAKTHEIMAEELTAKINSMNF